MRLARRERRYSARLSLVAMVDVLMNVLVFFMATSTYLDLDMVQLASSAPPSAQAGEASARPEYLLVRIDARGRAFVRGRAADAAELGARVASQRQGNPDLAVILLPSGQADVQALVSAMDALAAAGATRVRVVRSEGRQ